MTRNQVHLVVSPEAKKMLLVDCKKELLRSNPQLREQLKGLPTDENGDPKLGHDFMLKRVCRLFLRI